MDIEQEIVVRMPPKKSTRVHLQFGDSSDDEITKELDQYIDNQMQAQVDKLIQEQLDEQLYLQQRKQ